ncbi:MAG: zinc-binding dehydrogenase [Candidatus Glassbacteria bacterium]|nr:zinc-binding dehydrogenase [Candidatus Glassbacteria bacterium]
MTACENLVFYYTAPRKLEVIKEKCPSPGPGQILCRSVCSLVSIGTEMICFNGEVEPGSVWASWIKYPFEPGYSSVGEVVETGEGVGQIAPGDRVCSTSPHRAWFIDRPETVIPVPDGVAAEQAAWYYLNIIVQNGIREACPALGETAVVIGLGPLGQLAVRILGLAGLSRLIAVDPAARRCTLAEGNGPTEVLRMPADQAIDRVSELTRGRGADLVFDITGHPAAFHAAQHMLAKRGRLGLIGDVPFPSRQSLTHDVISKSLSIIAAHGAVPPWQGNDFYRWGKKEMAHFFFEMILAGRINLDKLFTHRIAPGEAPRLYQEISADRSAYMGVVIDWRKN